MASNFQNSAINFAEIGLQGENVLNPTAVDFSKTGNAVLFVTQQDGQIKRYGIERQDGADGNDTFVVTSAMTISTIVNGTQNYDDDGTLNSTQKRQVTGLVTATDEDGNDVLYVSSSDWRIAVSNDSGLDTNSGQIHRIVLDPETGAVLSNVALVRGLPRSEENHATNGLDIREDPVTGDKILWIAQGGNTNMGAPGDKFAGTVDFALSAAVLKVNLTALEAYDIRTDGAGNQFVLDLPTLDDPNRANIDLAALGVQNLAAAPTFTLDDNGTGTNGQLNPDWAGGSDGLNMAKIADHALVSEGGQLKLVQNPLSIHSPGFRNPYDVLITEDGDVYSWDNGHNAGWGGQPLTFKETVPFSQAWVEDWQTEFATNQYNNTGSFGVGDQLHYIGHVTDLYGPYAGQAHPIRAGTEAIAAAFNQDGSYAGATPDDPIVAHGVELFANEAEARSYLQSLLIIYAKQDGTWVDTGAPLPADFFDVVSGYHWAHPGSSIADPTAHFDGSSVMDGTAFSPESQLLNGNPTNRQDGSLFTVNSSTNGLAEYTASFFGEALKGAVMGASFDGSIYFVRPVDSNGDGRPDGAELLGSISGFGSTPLGLAALGDDGLSPTLIDNDGDGLDDFAGVIVAATYGADDITFFVPGGNPLDPSTDLDLDGIGNTLDTHVGDPIDGRGVSVGPGETSHWGFELNNPASTPPGAVPPGNSIVGDIGINAVWHNRVDPQVAPPGEPALYDPGLWNIGGASSFVSIDRADDGTAEGAANTQSDVLGIGFVVPSDTGLVTITSEMANIFAYSLNTNPGDGDPKSWSGGEKVGLVAGPGNQSDFVQAAVAVVNDGGTVRYGIELVVEENDTPQRVFVEIPGIEAPVTDGVGDPDMQVALDIDLNPGVMAVTARARYVDAGAYTDWVETPSLALPLPVFAALRGQYENEGRLTGGFVGLLSTTSVDDDSFGASWDWVEVTGTQRDAVSGDVVQRWTAASSDVAAMDGGPDWISDPGAIVGSAKLATSPIASSGTLHESVADTTPIAIFSHEYYGTSSTAGMGLEFGDGALEAGLYAVRLFMGNGYSKTNDPGERVFDVRIEDELFLDNVDLSGTLGHLVGGQFEWVGLVDDGTLDIDFFHGVENPLINGVEIIRLDDGGTTNSAPVISTSGALSAPENQTAVASIAATDADGDPITYSIAGGTDAAAFAVSAQAGALSFLSAPDFEAPGDADGDGVYEVVVGASDGQATTTKALAVTVTDVDESATGAAMLSVTPSGGIQRSTFNSDSFLITNTGDKVITRVVLDITDALYPDTVFDPFGEAGDIGGLRPLTINTNTSTGVVAPSNDSYIGAGGIDGYEGIQIVFDPANDGGFQSGEQLGFSIDLDPNSIAGASKATLDAGSDPSWDVGGVSGAELIGSTFTVEFSDGTSATGQLQGIGNQSGAAALASQASPDLDVALTVNGIAEGGAGSYGPGGPTVLIQGPSGEMARVVLTKGFIQPVTNEFPDTDDPNEYHDQLDAQLAALAGSDFPANNAVEFQTVDVLLDGTQQDISAEFDFLDVAAFNLTSFTESELPLGFAASVVDPDDGLPLGAVSDPIHLVYDELV